MRNNDDQIKELCLLTDKMYCSLKTATSLLSMTRFSDDTETELVAIWDSDMTKVQSGIDAYKQARGIRFEQE